MCAHAPSEYLRSCCACPMWLTRVVSPTLVGSMASLNVEGCKCRAYAVHEAFVEGSAPVLSYENLLGYVVSPSFSSAMEYLRASALSSRLAWLHVTPVTDPADLVAPSRSGRELPPRL